MIEEEDRLYTYTEMRLFRTIEYTYLYKGTKTALLLGAD